MVSDGVPVEVVDQTLWRDAQDLLAWHTMAEGGVCAGCGRRWPCPCRRLAERARVAAFGSWNKAWTARHDLNSVRAFPAARNTGSFPARTTPARTAPARTTPGRDAGPPPTSHQR